MELLSSREDPTSGQRGVMGNQAAERTRHEQPCSRCCGRTCDTDRCPLQGPRGLPAHCTHGAFSPEARQRQQEDGESAGPMGTLGCSSYLGTALGQQTWRDGAESRGVRWRSTAGEQRCGSPVPPRDRWLKIFIFSANATVTHRNACFETVCGNLGKESRCLLFTCLFIYGYGLFVSHFHPVP